MGEAYRLYIPRTNEINIRSHNIFINQVAISRKRLELWNSLTL